MCNGLRHADGFAKPVSLTYRKEEKFTTVVGGLCSIIYFLLIGSFFLSETMMLYYSPEYKVETTTQHLHFGIDNEPLVITPTTLMMAGKLFYPDAYYHGEHGYGLEELARI